MYKAKFIVSIKFFEDGKAFAPFLKAYNIHSVDFDRKWLPGSTVLKYVSVGNGFVELENRKKGEKFICGDDIMIVNINYFYKTNDYTCLDFIFDGNLPDKDKYLKIASQHYISAQFSLDNGLWKECIVNFGTMLEAILLYHGNTGVLNSMINNCSFDQNIKDLMHKIRKLRNKVHPARLLDTGEITIDEAYDTRQDVEQILFGIMKSFFNDDNFSLL